MDNQKLSEVIETIKSSASPGVPLSVSFHEVITQHDRTRCIAKIALGSLWNGEGPSGWIAPKVFWDMVTFMWHNVPDFFVADDPERMINEDPVCWDQKYLDVQRNFLRHNFSLRRLCHLVMVYEHLHGNEAREIRQEARREPTRVVSRLESAPVHEKGRSGLCGRWKLIVPIILVVGACVYMHVRSNSRDRPTQPANISVGEVAKTAEMDHEPARTVGVVTTASSPEAKASAIQSTNTVNSATAMQARVLDAKNKFVNNTGEVDAKYDEAGQFFDRMHGTDLKGKKSIGEERVIQKTNAADSIVILQPRVSDANNQSEKRAVKGNSK